ncbi:MAG TPA: hypothetical protein PKC28_04765 [Bdellovibrionales bacterium]|nr:hypothetical protein [Bdellovibrionales bacterium]
MYFQGVHTKQAHKAIPDGAYEEEQGLKGFFGPVSHLIKRQPSTRWSKIEGPLRPRMYDPAKLAEKNGWQRLLYNNHLTISMLSMDVSPEHGATATGIFCTSAIQAASRCGPSTVYCLTARANT